MYVIFTMIAVDENGKPAPVPKLELVTEDDKRRYNDAIARREMRMASRHSKFIFTL